MDRANDEECEDSPSAGHNLRRERSRWKRKLDARGAPKGSNTKLKESGLSENPATVRARERRRNLSPNSQAIRRAENADRNGVSKLVKKIKGMRGKSGKPFDKEYADASTDAERKAIIKLRTEEYMAKRFENGTSEEAVRARIFAKAKGSRQQLEDQLRGVADAAASAKRVKSENVPRSESMDQMLSLGYFQGMQRRMAMDTNRFMQKFFASGGVELQAMAYPELNREEALARASKEVKDYLESDFCEDPVGIMNPKTEYPHDLGIDEKDQVEEQIPDELEPGVLAYTAVGNGLIEALPDPNGSEYDCEDEDDADGSADDESDGSGQDGVEWFGETVKWGTDDETGDEGSIENSDDKEFKAEDDNEDDDDEDDDDDEF